MLVFVKFTFEDHAIPKTRSCILASGFDEGIHQKNNDPMSVWTRVSDFGCVLHTHFFQYHILYRHFLLCLIRSSHLPVTNEEGQYKTKGWGRRTCEALPKESKRRLMFLAKQDSKYCKDAMSRTAISTICKKRKKHSDSKKLRRVAV
ncbi:hypothetical protein J6590_005368 [Homalodisca vitripennis]|nr:hypothetical protein J6590_005368 [Homalodisca vitripennis]